MNEAVEKSAMRKIYIRLLPFAILSYFLAYVDRINVSFAALTMRDDLQMSATAYGFALGTFYWAYFIFEVPSNIAMEKVGARLWIARIMITWGLLACATAYVVGPTSFGVVRFLLGAAEAGFFPGIGGVIKDATGSFSGALYGLALLGLVSAIVCAFFLHIPTARVLPAAPARAAESTGN